MHPAITKGWSPSSTYQKLLTNWQGPQQLWTTGWAEHCDKWTNGGRKVTIIHLSEAPNPRVGLPTLHQPRIAPAYTIVSFVYGISWVEDYCANYIQIFVKLYMQIV